MPAEADKVVVELIAKNDQFDANVRGSANAYSDSMKRIETAGAGAEASHKKLTASIGNSRIAMLEFQHIARGTADQIAAGAPLTQVLTQHMAMLGEAVALSGSTFGKLGTFLGGPWGLALTVAVAGVAMLINRHKEESDTVEDVLKKRMKMHEQTLLNKQADEAWAHTLDGLIEGLQKTNDEIGKRLKLQPVVDQQALQGANAQLLKIGADLASAEQNGAPEARLEKLRTAFSEAVREVRQLTALLGREEGQALADLGERSKQWADRQQDVIDRLQGYHPELQAFAAQMNQSFSLAKKAVEDAANANVPFDGVTRQIDALNNKLAESPSFIKDYIAQMRALAQQLEATVQKAKDAPKAIEDFKKAVIGAEGTGPNRLGSSAAGFGQFMPSTFEGYFKRLFPQQAAGMSTAAIDDLRNNKEVATAVINAATDDYVKVLKNAGQQITAASLYTVHLLGAGDAKRFLSASADTPTSQVLSAAVLRGNPFLRGTVGSAQAAIAQRIGDSNSGVSAAAISMAKQLDSLEETMSQRLAKQEATEQEVTVAKQGQVELTRELVDGHTTLESLIRDGILPSTKAWEKQYEQLKASAAEFEQFSSNAIDELLNPDNWKHWGDTAKNVLHEIEVEIFKLGVINPIKNLLFGQNNSTLGSLFSLFGGGGGSIAGGGISTGTDAISFFDSFGGFKASGGPVAGGNAYVVGEQGPELFVPSGSGTIVPNNASAASPWGGGGQSQVVIGVQASEYFDARVIRTAGPVIAQSAVQSASGGATLARRNLSREALHRLEA